MRVAVRFPIKSNPVLFVFIVSLHLIVFLLSLVLLHSFLFMLIILTAVSTSFYYTYKEYFQLTNAPDDLCWNGNSWLMNLSRENKSQSSPNLGTDYLMLSETSWVTPYFCFLKFDNDVTPRAWFFTPSLLGDRLYRELCYLAHLNIKEMTKESNKSLKNPDL